MKAQARSRNHTSRYLIILLFALTAQVQAGRAQLADSIKQFIDSGLIILKNNSLYARKVNWKKVDSQVWQAAQQAHDKNGAFDALKIAFDALGDRHAAFYHGEQQYRLDNTALTGRYSDSLKAAWARGARIGSQMLGSMAYISIPFLGPQQQADIDKYANWVYDAVTKLNGNGPKGWIIDLRLNAGGNIRPMLAGLSMFFGDGTISYYIDRNGKATDEAGFSNGDFTIAGEKQASITNKIGYLQPIKVAVLIGPGTASSGEGVAVAFSQRQRTKLFGGPSAGLANATNGFVFDNNDSYFLLSVAKLGNRHKKALPEQVQPDVPVLGNDAFANLQADAVTKAAIEWLQQ